MSESLSRRDILRLEALKLATTNRSPAGMTNFKNMADEYFEWLLDDAKKPGPKKKLGSEPKTLV